MNYKYYLSVCVCIKNEAKYMHDFLQHYVDQGVDHFYIINNNSSDNIKETLDQSVYHNMITLITDNRNMGILENNSSAWGHKTLLDEHLYPLIKKETEWAIIIDADEIMYGKNGHTIKTYLSTVENNIGCVYVLWNIINPNKYENNNLVNTFLLKQEKKRLNYDFINELSYNIKNANDFGKSIVRTSMLDDNRKLWLHKNYVNGNVINNYGYNKNAHFDNCNDVEYSEENFKKLNITLNHYAIRNTDDYIKKQSQINVVTEKNNFIYGLFEILQLDDKYLVTDSDFVSLGLGLGAS